MRPAHIPSYSPAFALDAPIRNFGVVEIVKSTKEEFKAGQKLYGIFNFQSYDIIKSEDLSTLGSSGAWRVIENKENIPWSAWVGAAGMRE